MRTLLAAIDRQTGILLALAALFVAAALSSWGAWVLLRRERKLTTSSPAAADREPPGSG